MGDSWLQADWLEAHDVRKGSDATDSEGLGKVWKATLRGQGFIVFQSATEPMIDLIYDYYKLTINWNPDSFLFMGAEMEY